MKTIFKLVLFTVVILGAIAFSLFVIFNKSAGIPMEGVEFQIKDGDTSASIANRLYNQKLIRSKLFFRMVLRFTGLDKKIQTGYIKIESNDTTTDIIMKMLRGDFIKIKITVPEGYTLKEINKLLVNNNIVKDEEIFQTLNDPALFSYLNLPKEVNSLEGFLFPSTYTFYKGVSLKKIYQTMVNEMFKKIKEVYPLYESLSFKEFYKRLIIASIIEREVKNPDEAGIVSSVFYNRLKIGMMLQSCATVQYILDKPKEHLLETDLKIDNPYNTYLYKGLPPTPISNPGLIALKASFNPANTDYLFFVVKDPLKGTHYFSSTYEEHLRAQARYKQIKGFY